MEEFRGLEISKPPNSPKFSKLAEPPVELPEPCELPVLSKLSKLYELSNPQARIPG
jgi:hypothetical protein